ncbi:MAG TPA: alpha-L-fucosidase [Chthonomonadaceae bacterium]|nr:alpha-L-fucosidase [Chthonomonadaceae bacterium]
MKLAIAAALLLAALTIPPATSNQMPDATYQPTMESLKQYKCPEWFRDAKFGIWAHWGPQSVPMDGDWYARGMYEQGSKHYNYHIAHYGHPSQFGYKDIIPLWKAEKWDPDRLMKLYKRAGARYFVSMGSHHDNFFLWNSKLHRWNAVNMGPRRDVVGDWQKAAKREGLRFGVSEHLGASFTWFQASHRSDMTGPKAGVPYDGANPAYWDLYHFPAEPGDTGWYSNNPKWQAEWLSEIEELVDNYHPDLLYSDGGVPFGNEVGLGMIAHFYNQDAARHGGKVEAIYNCKQASQGRWVEDIERGIMPKIDPNPWQTDTSIGDWFYDRNWKYRPLSWVVHTLVDNVSKNGNLLLNVVQRPDGSLDPEVEQMLEQMAQWTAVHGEAIYKSRPWLVYGEGAVRAKGGAFKEDFQYSAGDIRFTTRGATLYALALGWPKGGTLTIRSLARPRGETYNKIADIRLLGYKGRLTWEQTAEGLVIHLPAQPVSELTTGLKITGTDLRPAPIAETVTVVQPDAEGRLTLAVDAAETHGDQIRVEQRGGKSNVGFWDRPGEFVTWRVHVARPGAYRVTASVAAVAGGAELAVALPGGEAAGAVPSTGGWDSFRTIDLGRIEIAAPGDVTITVRPRDAGSWKAINLREVTLTPAR